MRLTQELSFGAFGRTGHAQQGNVADDHGEQVIEIVGNPACQLADRFHFTGLAQLFLEAAALGNVAGDADEPQRPSAQIEEGCFQHFEQRAPLVGVFDPFFRSLRRTLGEGLAFFLLVRQRPLARPRSRSLNPTRSASLRPMYFSNAALQPR